MINNNEKLIKNGKIGILYWFISCLLGSFVLVAIERNSINNVKGFHLSLLDGVVLTLLMTAVTFIISSPVIFAIFYFSKRTKQLSKSITRSLVFTFILAYFGTYYLTQNLIESLYFIFPYFLCAFVFKYFYLKFEKSI
jgi:hypothetical protein